LAALRAALALPRSAPGRARALLALRAAAYDVVANGVELGGGSERLSEAAVQRAVLERLLLPAGAAAEGAGFGPLLAALDAGAPPHAGAALGLDRLVAALAGPEAAASVRDVIAFPKAASGACALTGAPACVRLRGGCARRSSPHATLDTPSRPPLPSLTPRRRPPRAA